MARVYTKIGDVFCANLGDYKKYFQLVAYDQTQLNSDVIRAFKKKYPLDAKPELSEIVKNDIDFYAHCVTKFGVKKNLWKKIGSSKEIGDLSKVMFRDTNDLFKLPPVKKSENWFIWHINDDDFTYIGKLEGKYKKTYLGPVFNPYDIIEFLKGNQQLKDYPEPNYLYYST